MGRKRNKIAGILLLSVVFVSTMVPTKAFAQAAPEADLHLAVKKLLAQSNNIARLGLQEVKSPDIETSKAIEISLLQILQEEGIDVLTPEKVKQQIQTAGESGKSPVGSQLWADHLLMGEATTTGSKTLVALRLVQVATGQMVADVQAFGGNAVRQSSLEASTVRGAVERIADGLHYEMGKLPGESRYQRVAVMPLEENGAAAANLLLGSYLQQEIGMALMERGYLTVERSRLNEAIAQMGIAQALSAENAPATGKMLGAQLLIVGSVSEAGDRFVITSRALDARTGQLLGTAQVNAKRDNIVTLASGAIDTRSAGGAAFRSVIVAGWGHFYYKKPVRGMMWAIGTYTGAVVALGSLGAAYQQQMAYDDFVPENANDPKAAQSELASLRNQANNLYTVAAIASGATAVLWLSNITDAFITGYNAE